MVLTHSPRMTEPRAPSTAAECVDLLGDVLTCLDSIGPQQAMALGERMSLAAMHVQQAIELIQTA